MKKLSILAIFLTFLSSVCLGRDFEYNGLVYTVISEDEMTAKLKEGYQKSTNSPYVAGNPGAAGHVEIPSIAYDGDAAYTVCSIPPHAFFNNEKITSVSIPSSVRIIDELAFCGCKSLEAVYIEEGLQSIEEHAFDWCKKLREIKLPTSLLKLGDWVFPDDTSMSDLILPPNLTEMGRFSVNNSNIKKVAIPSGFPVDLSTVFGREQEKCVEYPKESYLQEDGRIYSPDKTSLWYVSTSEEGNVSLPETVMEIGPYAFKDCDKVTALERSSELKHISEGAFFRCTSLESFDFPDTMEKIEDSTLAGCTSLVSVRMPASLRSIGTSAFQGCSVLTGVDIPQSVEIISGSAFSLCTGLISVVIPPGVKTISEYAFSGCNLSDITIPEGVECLDTYSLSGNSFESITLPESLTTIQNYALAECVNLKKLFVPHNVKSIGIDVVRGSYDLEQVVVGRNVENMTSQSFSGLIGLKKLAYPDNVLLTGVIKGAVRYPASDAVFEDGMIYDGTRSTLYFADIDTEGQVILHEGLQTIYPYAFTECHGITSVVMSNSIQEIGACAFKNCDNMRWLVAGNGLENLAGDALDGCTAISKLLWSDKCFIFLQNGCANIVYDSRLSIEYDKGLVYGHSEKDDVLLFCSPDFEGHATVRDGVNKIGKQAFESCQQLTSVELPESLTRIEDYAFLGADTLADLTVHAPVPPLCANDAFTSAMTEGKQTRLHLSPETALLYASVKPWSDFFDILTPGGKVFRLNDGQLSYACSEETHTASVLKDDSYQSFTGVSIPARVAVEENGEATFYKVEGIAPRAFDGCKDISVLTLGRNLKWIGESAFKNCTSIRSVKIPELIEEIPDSCFMYNYINNLELNDKIRRIGDNAFYSANLSSIAFPASLEEIGREAFTMCPFEEITFNEGLIRIGAGAFIGFIGSTHLKTVSFPSTLMEIGDGAFRYNQGLTTVNFNENLQKIGDRAFERCYIKTLSFPAGLKSIGESAFRDNSSIGAIYFNEGLETIGDYAFNGIYLVSGLKFPDSLKSIGDYCFENHSKSPALKYIDFGNGIEYIGKYAFASQTSLYDVHLPASMRIIDEYAFTESAIRNITMENGIETISDYAFKDCSGLLAVSFPASMKYVGKRAFENCISLTDVSFEDSDEPIDVADQAFLYTYIRSAYVGRPLPPNALATSATPSLSTIVVGGHSYVAPGSLSYQEALSNLVILDGVTEIQDNAFANCKVLGTVVIPPSVKKIGAGAFSFCNLKYLAIGHGIQDIAENAFSGNDKLENVYITAVEPPHAANSAFSSYAATLHVPSDSYDKYMDCPSCWYRFENSMERLVEPVLLSTESSVSADVVPGDSFQLTTTFTPEETTLQHLFYLSTNPDVASVDHHGVVTYHGNQSDDVEALSDASEPSDCEIQVYTLYADSPRASFRLEGILSEIESVSVDDSSDIQFDLSKPYEVYSMQGYRIFTGIETLEPGTYIIRQGNLSLKISLRR